MESFMLSQAAKWTNGYFSVDAQIHNISKNSKDIKENCMFWAIKGKNFDGHDYIEQAIKNGAKAIMSHRQDEVYSVPTFYVKDTVQAMLDIAKGYKNKFDCKITAVTGSVGKTTTKGLISCVLSERFKTHFTKGNFNNQIGMPLTLLQIEKKHQVAVIEMGMSGFGEILSMTKCCQPDIAVITNIGTAHIEFLGSRDGICKAKMEILHGLYERNGTCILNGDERLLFEKRNQIKAKTIWFGIENKDCDVRAEDIKTNSNSVEFMLVYKNLKTNVKLNIAGVHNVSNALAAASVGFVMGMSQNDIARGLYLYKPEQNRQCLYEKNGFIIYDDCYNASSASMKAAIDVLSNQKAKNKIAVLGSMLELGEHSQKEHFETGFYAAKTANVLYFYGQYAGFMKDGALNGGANENNIYIFETHEQIVKSLKEKAKKGDAILFKGSRSMKMENVLEMFLGEEV